MSTERGIISTYTSRVDLVFEWKIENFFDLSERDGAEYYSPEFSFGGEKWMLFIFPNGSSRNDSSGHVDLELVKCRSNRSIKQSFSLSLITAKGEKYNEQHRMIDFKNYGEVHLKRFIPRSELYRRRSDLVPDGVLTIICTMECSTSAGSDSEACASGSSISSHWKKLHDDLKELFLKKEDCDVIIKVKGSDIPAHRVILKARSPVFASTFQHNMKENATGVVEIEDSDPSPFTDFLNFLYCGDIGMISEENVFDLFRLADKYEVLDLKVTCLEFMKKNIIVDTFCETIALALQYSETELIALTTDFFVRNAEEILQTIKWQTFAAENSTQSNELTIKLVKWFKHSNA